MASQKILVLGATGFPPGVTAYSWDKLPSDLNVADFDVVILNLAAFEDDDALRVGIQTSTLPRRAQFARLLFSESEVISIGRLTTKLGDGSKRTVLEGFSDVKNEELTSWWLPVTVRVVTERGEVRDYHYAWRSILEKKLKRYEWYFEHLPAGMTEPGYQLRGVHPKARAISVHGEAMASTRFGKAVAVGLRLGAHAKYSSGKYDPDMLVASGAIYLLPRPSEGSAAELIDLILTERFKLAAEDRPPDWLGGFELPNEAAPRQDAERHLAAAKEAYARYEEAEQARAEQARLRKLLYETGEDALEPVVRDALRRLELT